MGPGSKKRRLERQSPSSSSDEDGNGWRAGADLGAAARLLRVGAALDSLFKVRSASWLPVMKLFQL